MSNLLKKSAVLAVALALLAFASSAQAGYINLGAGGAGPSSGSFTYLGTPTKWDPGVNSASFHGFVAPAGPMTPGGATWSVMGAGIADPGVGVDSHGGVSTSMATILAALPAGASVDTVLGVWAAASGFTNLGGVADSGGIPGGADGIGTPGDIRIGAYAFDGPSMVLAHAFQPGTNAIFVDGSIAGDVHFDNAEAWIDDMGGGGGFDVFTVMLHEFGHSLGLGHSAVVGSVMEAFYAGPRRMLGADDIAGITTIYGPGAIDPPIDPIPEPGILALLAIAVLGIAVRRKRTA